ncbi:MAG: signal recognition particle protein [Bacillota bacterium]|nr:signal recognition particle protein [Bacillota bacterium]
MFGSLGDRLQQVMRRLRGKGKLAPGDVEAAMRELRMALLEADVSYKVARDFVARVGERAVGQEVLESLTPAQQVVKIVHEELTQLLGGHRARLTSAGKPPTVVMLVGLQGSGKTTTCGKLASLLKREGHGPVLAALDTQRPAAGIQLRTLATSIGVACFVPAVGSDPVAAVPAAVAECMRAGGDYLLLDTAGRLHVDAELMQQLAAIKTAARPHEILLVVDAMTGQDAVKVAEEFSAQVGIDGVILTKMEGDARGGAALSVKAVTGKPIKFAGVGEKLDALEPFHPERMASRILGMGDVLTLIERAQENIDTAQAADLEKRLRQAEFTLDDFIDQLKQVRKMGGLDQLLGMIPGLGNRKLVEQVSDRDLAHTEAIISSMTPEERRNPGIIDGSRRRRIARGSGTDVQAVNRLLRSFQESRRLLRAIGGKDKGLRGGRGRWF